MMTKQDKIREAYGIHWEEVKDQVDENGWLDGKGNHKGLVGLTMKVYDPYDSKYCYWKRPVSLSGIENNNGWIKIESKQDLPSKKGLYMVCINNNPIIGIIENTTFIKHLYECPEQGILTHFKEHFPEKHPIY